MPDLDGSAWATIIAAGFAFAAAIYAAFSARRNRRDQERYESRSPTPPTTQEVWDRLGVVEAKLAACGRMFQDISDQWPEGHPHPHFDRADWDLVRDEMPASWRRRPPTSRQERA